MAAASVPFVGGEEEGPVMHPEEQAVIGQGTEAVALVKPQPPAAQGVLRPPFRGLGLHQDPLPSPKLLLEQAEDLAPQPPLRRAAVTPR